MKNYGWKEVPLGTVLTERQETPDPVAIECGAIRIVSKIGFNTGRIEFRTDGRTKTKMITIHPGDLVLSGINAAKGAIAIYPESEEQVAAATIHYGAYIVRHQQARPKYLWWLLRSRTFREILTHHLPGGIKTELKANRLLPIPVPLPSVSEQDRIVAILEETSDQIGEAQRLCKNLQKEAAALLNANLNELSERFAPIKGTLSDVLSDKPRNGWSARCDNDINGNPILTLSAVTGFRYVASAIKRTSLPTDPRAHYWLRRGDLLITRSNSPDLVGHAAIYSGEPSPCIYPDLMMCVPIDERLANKEFVWFWLQTPHVRPCGQI